MSSASIIVFSMLAKYWWQKIVCYFLLTFSTLVRICSLLMSSWTLNSRSPRRFSLCISCTLWARAALDNMLGGYMENLKTQGLEETFRPAMAQ